MNDRHEKKTGSIPRRRRFPALSVRVRMRQQRGISVMVVIFLLAVVSMMTVSLLTLSGTQHISSLYAQRAAQAYFAAHGGIEHALDLLEAGGVGACGNITINPAMGMAGGFTVNILCTQISPVAGFNEGNPAAYHIFRLTATASSGNFDIPEVANRRITVTVKVP